MNVPVQNLHSSFYLDSCDSWYLAVSSCTTQGSHTREQYFALPTCSNSEPKPRTGGVFQSSAAGRAAPVLTSQTALQTHWPHPVHTEWRIWKGEVE